MRLIDELAADHSLYPRPIPTLPDILLLAIRERHAAASLPLGRYYPIIVETAEEFADIMTFLRKDRLAMAAPDLLDRRPSSLATQDIAFCRYEPPYPGWPWLLLCHWPPAFTRMIPPNGDAFARSAYTIELFRTADDLEAMQIRLLETLGTRHAVTVRFVTGGAVGRA